MTAIELENRPEIQAAAKWWVDLLRARQTITASTSMDAWAYQARASFQVLTDEQIEMFRAALMDVLIEQIAEEGVDGDWPVLWLGNDFTGLVGSLKDLSEVVGINNLRVRLPTKTFMWVSGESVEVRQHGELTKVYPAEVTK